MNVLPLVSAFLILFAICSYSFVHNLRTILEEKTHFVASLRAQRMFSQAIDSKAYRKIKGKNLHPIKQIRGEKKEVPYRSPRDWVRKKEESKCNLRPLLSEDHPKLERIICTLLRDLYQFAPFYQPGLEDLILHHLLETMQEHKDLATFEELLSKLPPEHFSLFYKLVQGTQKYALHTTEGYPPLGDFLSIQPLQNQTPPIQFPHASRPLLNAVFGPTAAPLIVNQEMHKWEKDHKHVPLSKQELQAFLINRQLNPADYEPLFSFSTKSSAPPLEIIRDAETGVQLRISL